MITKILYQLIRTVDWKNDGQEVDFMIIDMPPGTGDIYLSLAQNFPIDGVVIVSTPQMVAVKDVARSIDCFEKLKIPIIGLVQNMAYIDANGSKQYIFGKDNAKNMAQELKIKFLGDIELAQEISDANEASTPFMIDAKASNLSLNFGKIAEDIIEGL
jgi:ATP-binding protein involved in chromosome partitioning